MMKPESIRDIELKLFIEAVSIRYAFDLKNYDKGKLKYYLSSLLLVTGGYCLNDVVSILLNDERLFAMFISDLLIK